MLVACVLGAITGGFLGYAGARFSVLYISLLTLAFNLVVLEVIGMWQSLTGGDQGMPVDVLESVFGPTFSSASGGVNGVIILFGIVLADRRVRARHCPADASRGGEVASGGRADGRHRARVPDGARASR